MNRVLLVGSLLLVLYQAGIRTYGRFLKTELVVTFFDVGQGDSALIEFPGGTRWLVDGGGAFLERSIGRRDLFSELTTAGILTLDAMVLSHPDLDHGEGLLALLTELRVEKLMVNAKFLTDPKPLMKLLMARAGVRKVPLKPISQTIKDNFNGVTTELVPLKGETANDSALAIHLSYERCSILFTGDLEREGEASLAAHANIAQWPPVTVLKVAHHGSRTSSTPKFLKTIRPRFSAVSSGTTNRYGHPNAMIVDRLRQFGSEVLRTDFHGYLRFRFFKGGTFACETALGNCGQGVCPKPR